MPDGRLGETHSTVPEIRIEAETRPPSACQRSQTESSTLNPHPILLRGPREKPPGSATRIKNRSPSQLSVTSIRSSARRRACRTEFATSSETTSSAFASVSRGSSEKARTRSRASRTARLSGASKNRSHRAIAAFTPGAAAPAGPLADGAESPQRPRHSGCCRNESRHAKGVPTCPVLNRLHGRGRRASGPATHEQATCLTATRRPRAAFAMVTVTARLGQTRDPRRSTIAT